MSYFIKILYISLCFSLFFGCAATDSRHIPRRTQKIIHQAEQADFVVEIMPTNTFQLTTISKHQSQQNPIVHAYVEGDGNSWKTRYQLSDNPTPRQPLALKLALRDPHPNVIYIARPCQYTPVEDDPYCEPKFWSSHRYAEEVIAAVQGVMDQPKYANARWVLIGFSGGASVATLVASERDDVDQILTVAGDLNHVVLNDYHGTTPLSGSLNPSDRIGHLRLIPQTHWCGTKDTVVPCWTVQAYCEQCDNPSAVHCNELKGATHHAKWEKAWPEILRKTL